MYTGQYDADRKYLDIRSNLGKDGHEFDNIALQCSGETSDGYHTFNELYYHRMILFSLLCKQYKEYAWKSTLHSDGSHWDGLFIVGINTPVGQYTYHYKVEYWDMFQVKELDLAPEYDGHQPSDILRLFTLDLRNK